MLAALFMKQSTASISPLLDGLCAWVLMSNAQGGHFGNALQAAADQIASKELVQMLLEAGADANAMLMLKEVTLVMPYMQQLVMVERR